MAERRSAHRWRVLVPLAVLVIAIVGAGGAWAATRSKTPTTGAATTRLVSVTTGTIQQAVSTSGTIEPATTSELSFGSAGKVTAVKVGVGTHVRSGSVLATMDSATLTAAVYQAKANLANAEASLTKDVDNDASTTQLSADRAAVTSAQAQVSSAKTALAGATLTAPVTGTVAQVNLTVGEQIAGGGSSSGGSAGGSSAGASSASGSASSAGSSAGSGSTGSSSSSGELVVISDAYVVDATVDATEVGAVKVGDQAIISISSSTSSTAGAAGVGSRRATGGTGTTTTSGGTAESTGPVYGVVSSVGLIASTSSGVATFPVVMEVTGTPKGLYAGTPVTVSIIYRQLSGVLVVPTLAVQQQAGTAVVDTMTNGKRVTRTVTTGATSGGMTQILRGLTAGQQVVVTIPAAVANRTGGSRTGFGGTGGFGGGGFGGGGFGGGAGGARPGAGTAGGGAG